MKVISFNCNSLAARLPIVKSLIENEKPDLLLLQETRCNQEYFDSVLDELGYRGVLNSHSKSGYAGVATLYNPKTVKFNTKMLVNDLAKGRVLATAFTINNVLYKVYNCYIHQGKSVDHEDYTSKLKLMEYLASIIPNSHDSGNCCILAGDFNICPEDYHVWSTTNWDHSVIARTPPEIDSFNNLYWKCRLYNIEPAEGEAMSWYGYRHAWRKMTDGVRTDLTNKYGIKCDHILANFTVARDSSLTILDKYRFGVESPSDHIPLMLEID